MNRDIREKINELQEAIFDYGDKDCVSINLFFNCEGMEVKINKRTAEQLEQQEISMRNVKGEFIK